MKKTYSTPNAEVIRFATEDILADSKNFVSVGNNTEAKETGKTPISWN